MTVQNTYGDAVIVITVDCHMTGRAIVRDHPQIVSIDSVDNTIAHDEESHK